MRKLVILLLLIILLLSSNEAVASPFMVSDPSPAMIGGFYEVYEVTTAYPSGRLAYSAVNEANGSIKMDLNEIPIGTHSWKVRQSVNGNFNAFIPVVLIVSSLHYKSTTTSFNYYTESKSWTFKINTTVLGMSQ